MNLFCISVVFVLYFCCICTVIVAGCTLPTLHHSWKWRSPATSPTQTSAHLAQPNPGTPLPHTPQPQLTSSGPPNQAIGPPGPVQAPEGPQTVVSGPPAACVCPYVGGQPPILNLLPLRYLLTFINFVTQPPSSPSSPHLLVQSSASHQNSTSSLGFLPPAWVAGDGKQGAPNGGV